MEAGFGCTAFDFHQQKGWSVWERHWTQTTVVSLSAKASSGRRRVLGAVNQTSTPERKMRADQRTHSQYQSRVDLCWQRALS